MSRRRVLACSLLCVCGAGIAQVPPQSENDRLRLAETALEKNDLRTAAALLTVLAQERPHDAHVLYDLGYADEGLNDLAGAKQAYAAAATADPQYAEARISLGLLLARTGDQVQAVGQLRAGAENATAPPEFRAHALRALATLEAESQPAQAADDLLKAVQLSHETEPDIVQGADFAYAAGRDADAEQAYRRALDLQPDDVSAVSGLGQVLRREGKLAEADALLAAALAKQPNDPRLLASLAAVKAGENKAPEAIALLEPLLPAGAAARNPALSRELARLYMITGQMPKAEALYGELVAGQPNHPALLDDYADVLVRESKFAQAQAILEKAVAERSAWASPEGWAEAAGHLAFAASRNKQPQTTLQALAARATVLPNSAATLFLQATAYDSLHQIKQAIESYQAFLSAADGKFPDEEFEARHRTIALQHMK